MKRKIAFLIVLALVTTFLFSFTSLNSSQVSAAQTFQKVDYISGVVTATMLNVRQGPSTSHKIVSVLKKGKWVNILAKMGDWYAIYDPDTGIVGAASAKYIVEPSKLGSTPQTVTTPKTTNPTPTPSTTTKTPTDVTDEEQTLLNLINKERANAGLAGLKFDMDLQKCARLKAKDMVDNNYFSHQSPTYGSPFDMMRQFGVTFKSAGENIAGNRTLEGAVTAWMNSEGHRKNILNGNFNYTGIGIVSSSTYGKILVQQFIGK